MDINTPNVFWNMTINNYDDNDVALVQQAYPDFIRQLVWTFEEGEQGTPHIQAYIKLFRQQRISFVKKLFPRGSFKQCYNEEYKLNAQRYAQKQDATARGPSVINNNPFPDPINELLSICEVYYNTLTEEQRQTINGSVINGNLFDVWCHSEQLRRVRQKPHLAKFYVSNQYKEVKKIYWWPILQNIMDTHTHTHTEPSVVTHTYFTQRVTNASNTSNVLSECESTDYQEESDSCESSQIRDNTSCDSNTSETYD